MVSLASRLNTLLSEPPDTSVVMLAAALDHAEPEEAGPIAKSLLGLDSHPATAAVIRNLHKTGHEAEALIRSSSASFVEPARVLLGQADAQTTINLIAVAETTGDWRLLPMAAELLLSPVQSAPARAAEIIFQAVMNHLGQTGRRIPDEGISLALDAALGRAADHYREHRMESVLVAIGIASSRPGPRLATVFKEPDHPVIGPLRGVAERTDQALVRRNLLRWLKSRQLGRPVLRWLCRLKSVQDFSDLLNDGHLLLAPERRQALRQADRPGRCLPGMEVAAALPRDRQAALPAYVSSLGVTSSLRVQRLIDLTALPAPTARIKAALALAAHHSAPARKALERLLRDRDEAVHRAVASMVLVQPDAFEPDSVKQLEESSQPTVARQATNHLASLNVDTFFQRWRRLSHPTQVAIARRLLATNRLAFVRLLEIRLMEGDRSEALAAIALASRLRLIVDLEGEVILQTASGDAHIASASAGALAWGRTERRLQALQAALSHDNGRVRANALEALAISRWQGIVQVLGEFVAERDNRLRANALRALLPWRAEEALLGLRGMLNDHDPLHRVSGIWLARRVAHPAVLMELKLLAGEDERPEIRSRALMALRIHQSDGVGTAPAGSQSGGQT